ncbi:MAG: hypothetical protein LUH51_01175 [Firmicutes bacterium]|nr:hypothetical protein [Bacillota bacterium]
MIHLILGLKGSGKTKTMIDSINEAVATASGDVVCIEFGNNLTYDINYRVRLVDAKQYGIVSADLLKGLLCGLHAGNFDITNVYIDGLYKIIGRDKAVCDEFLTWCDAFSAANDMNLTLLISDDPSEASETVKKYL